MVLDSYKLSEQTVAVVSDAQFCLSPALNALVSAFSPSAQLEPRVYSAAYENVCTFGIHLGGSQGAS
jgi:hypothetical protein